jgi:predicted acylesterase/phospholipase RssA
MEPPASLQPKAIVDEKVKLFQAMRPLDPDELVAMPTGPAPAIPTRQGGWNGQGVFTWGMTAFVLSGGANRGSVQAGMLEALLDAGIRPDLLVGESIGAARGGCSGSAPHVHDLLRNSSYGDWDDPSAEGLDLVPGGRLA